MTARTVTLFDPTPPREAAGAAGARRGTALAGRTVGFIDNAKPNFNHLVDDLADLLTTRYGVKAVVKRRKTSASIPAPPGMLREITDACDVVIAGSGD